MVLEFSIQFVSISRHFKRSLVACLKKITEIKNIFSTEIEFAFKYFKQLQSLLTGFVFEVQTHESILLIIRGMSSVRHAETSSGPPASVMCVASTLEATAGATPWSAWWTFFREKVSSISLKKQIVQYKIQSCKRKFKFKFRQEITALKFKRQTKHPQGSQDQQRSAQATEPLARLESPPSWGSAPVHGCRPL
jgi:hypothetical protein